MSYPPVPYPPLHQNMAPTTPTGMCTTFAPSSPDVSTSVAQAQLSPPHSTQTWSQSSAAPFRMNRKRSNSFMIRHGVRAAFKKHCPVGPASSSPPVSSSRSIFTFNPTSDDEEDLPTFRALHRAASPEPSADSLQTTFTEFSVPRSIKLQNDLLTVPRHEKSAYTIYEHRVKTLDQGLKIQRATDRDCTGDPFSLKWLDQECEKWKRVGRVAAKKFFQVCEPSNSDDKEPRDEQKAMSFGDSIDARGQSDDLDSDSEDDLVREVNDMIRQAKGHSIDMDKSAVKRFQDSLNSTLQSVQAELAPSNSEKHSLREDFVPRSGPIMSQNTNWTLSEALATINVDAKILGWNEDLGLFL
ncbi:hypothetical protein OIV83_003218 [Microbotryomycetes sp. JL201]|nr:hypothetical protein OIV83_003218 [Microbotryomycetes sp. JL201]